MTAEDNTMRQIDVPTRTHGRVVVEEGLGQALRLVVGFHGYGQNADEMLRELRALPVASPWTTAAVQALHRFYRGRSEVTVASWMTRQDRDLLIADNIAYVDEAVSQLAAGRPIERLIFCGFSQGVAMAFRAAARGHHCADLVVGARWRRAAGAAPGSNARLASSLARARQADESVLGRATCGGHPCLARGRHEGGRGSSSMAATNGPTSSGSPSRAG